MVDVIGEVAFVQLSAFVGATGGRVAVSNVHHAITIDVLVRNVADTILIKVPATDAIGPIRTVRASRTGGESCYRCGSDLSELLQLEKQAKVLFDRARGAYALGRFLTARQLDWRLPPPHAFKTTFRSSSVGRAGGC